MGCGTWDNVIHARNVNASDETGLVQRWEKCKEDSKIDEMTRCKLDASQDTNQQYAERREEET